MLNSYLRTLIWLSRSIGGPLFLLISSFTDFLNINTSEIFNLSIIFPFSLGLNISVFNVQSLAGNIFNVRPYLLRVIFLSLPICIITSFIMKSSLHLCIVSLLASFLSGLFILKSNLYINKFNSIKSEIFSSISVNSGWILLIIFVKLFNYINFNLFVNNIIIIFCSIIIFLYIFSTHSFFVIVESLYSNIDKLFLPKVLSDNEKLKIVWLMRLVTIWSSIQSKLLRDFLLNQKKFILNRTFFIRLFLLNIVSFIIYLIFFNSTLKVYIYPVQLIILINIQNEIYKSLDFEYFSNLHTIKANTKFKNIYYLFYVILFLFLVFIFQYSASFFLLIPFLSSFSCFISIILIYYIKFYEKKLLFLQ